MSEMFYEEERLNRSVRAGGSTSKMAQWLMKKGIAKTESAASVILIGVAVVAIALTFWIMKGDDIKRSFQTAPDQTGQSDFQERREARLNQ